MTVQYVLMPQNSVAATCTYLEDQRRRIICFFSPEESLRKVVCTSQVTVSFRNSINNAILSECLLFK